MALTSQQEIDLLALLAIFEIKKTVTDLESAVAAEADMLLAVEKAGATKNISVADIADFALLNFVSATTEVPGKSILSSQITIANNATDANNDIDFSGGVLQFFDGTGQAVATALIKRLDANWAAGTNQGGLFTGSKAADTTYHAFAIYNPTTNAYDAGFDTSVVAANRPDGFTKYKRVGSILTNGSSNIIGFTQYGKWFKLKTMIINVATNNPGTSAVAVTLSVPLNIQTIWDGYVSIFDELANVLTWYALISSMDMANATPDVLVSNLRIPTITSSSNDVVAENNFLIATNTTQQIRYRLNRSTVNITIYIYTNGWIDYQL